MQNCSDMFVTGWVTPFTSVDRRRLHRTEREKPSLTANNGCMAGNSAPIATSLLPHRHHWHHRAPWEWLITTGCSLYAWCYDGRVTMAPWKVCQTLWVNFWNVSLCCCTGTHVWSRGQVNLICVTLNPSYSLEGLHRPPLHVSSQTLSPLKIKEQLLTLPYIQGRKHC